MSIGKGIAKATSRFHSRGAVEVSDLLSVACVLWISSPRKATVFLSHADFLNLRLPGFTFALQVHSHFITGTLWVGH